MANVENTLSIDWHAKSIPLESESLRTNTWLSVERIDFFVLIKARNCIGNNIVFVRDKVDVWAVLFNVIETEHDAVGGSVVGGNVKVVDVNVQLGT